MSEETPLHLFRDCGAIQLIWRTFVPTNYHEQFFQSSFLEWVDANITQKHLLWEGVEWNMVFFGICWWQWKYQNDVVFKGSATPLNPVFLKKKN